MTSSFGIGYRLVGVGGGLGSVSMRVGGRGKARLLSEVLEDSAKLPNIFGSDAFEWNIAESFSAVELTESHHFPDETDLHGTFFQGGKRGSFWHAATSDM